MTDCTYLSSSFYNPDLRMQGDYLRIYQASTIQSIEAFVKNYKDGNLQDTDRTILSASMLGTSVTVGGQSIESYFDDDGRILQYCLARIDEIEAINRYSHTPSAYGGILRFLAFLGQATHNATNQDEVHFKEFCNKHVLRLRCKRIERVESGSSPNQRTRSNDVNTWGEVLYKLVRCGLIHSMSSQGNRDPQQNEVEIRLTHGELGRDGVVVCDFKDQSGNIISVLDPSWSAVTIVINAFDLISAIRDSIPHIYADGSDVQNMRAYFKTHPPLMGVVECKPGENK